MTELSDSVKMLEHARTYRGCFFMFFLENPELFDAPCFGEVIWSKLQYPREDPKTLQNGLR